MIKRLIENDIALHKDSPSGAGVKLWLKEGRTPEHLIQLAQSYPGKTEKMVSQRPLLAYALKGDLGGLTKALSQEEQLEREKDIEYWKPLREELEKLRHEKLA